MKHMKVTLNVNGVGRRLVVDTNALLAEVLRDDLGLQGIHTSCGYGDCGACTVLVDGQPTLACLTLAVTVRDLPIITIEGVAQGPRLHPLQRAFVDKGAVQCGYCTPGMVLSAMAFLEQNPRPNRHDVQEGLAGNLCRCTGYNKVIDAVLDAAGVEVAS